MKNKKTKSEILFEEICCLYNISFEKLAECSSRKQPDYELRFNGQTTVFEVKQVEPNNEDKHFNKTLRCNHFATQTRNPDRVAERVRNLIKSARDQIKSYLCDKRNVPSVVVIYDHANNSYTDPYTIQTAMYGWERIQFNVHHDNRPPEIIDRGFGDRNNKIIREDNYTEISAVATLHEFWHSVTRKRFLSLCVYHNNYATNYFEPTWWQSENVQHYMLSKKASGQYQEWEFMEK